LLNDLSHQPPTRCHLLYDNREGQYAVDLGEQKRLIFEPISEEGLLIKGGSLGQITRVRILEVVDYHD